MSQPTLQNCSEIGEEHKGVCHIGFNCRDRHGENDKQIGFLFGRNLRIGKGEPIKYTLSF